MIILVLIAAFFVYKKFYVNVENYYYRFKYYRPNGKHRWWYPFGYHPYYKGCRPFYWW